MESSAQAQDLHLKIPQVGEPAPFFTATTDGVERYSLDVVAGRWIVLMFFATAGADRDGARGWPGALERRDLFNGRDAAFFGVSVDPADRAERGLVNSDPGRAVLLGLRSRWVTPHLGHRRRESI